MLAPRHARLTFLVRMRYGLGMCTRLRACAANANRSTAHAPRPGRLSAVGLNNYSVEAY